MDNQYNDIKVGGGKLRTNQHRTSENHPVFKGGIQVTQDIPAGTAIWLAVWKRIDEQTGESYLSIACSINDRSQGQQGQNQGRPAQQQRAPQRISQQALNGRGDGFGQGNGQRPRPMPSSLDDEIPF